MQDDTSTGAAERAALEFEARVRRGIKLVRLATLERFWRRYAAVKDLETRTDLSPRVRRKVLAAHRAALRSLERDLEALQRVSRSTRALFDRWRFRFMLARVVKRPADAERPAGWVLRAVGSSNREAVPRSGTVAPAPGATPQDG